MTTLTTRISSASVMKRNVAMLLCCVLVLSVFLLGNMETAYCTGTEGNTNAGTEGNTNTGISDTLVQVFNSTLTELYSTIRQFIAPLAILAFAVAGVMFVMGGRQGPEKARGIMLAGVAGLIIVVFAPVIVQQIALWVVDVGGGDLSNYNPLA